MTQDHAEMFKVLGVETRVNIIELLKSEGPLGAKKIAEMLAITPAAVSQHLKILKQARLVRSERQGFWIPYSIDEKALEKCGQLLNEVCTCGCEGTGNFRKIQLSGSDSESLRNYEKALEDELARVRERLKEMK